MVAPELHGDLSGSAASSGDARPVLGHVNLMVDTFIANANLEDLRAIVRGMLATSPPSVAAAFTAAARQRLVRVKATDVPDTTDFFAAGPDGSSAEPTEKLNSALLRIRTLYGSGLGFASLKILARVVGATVGLRWDEDGAMEDTLAIIDADISQAIQSAKEELDGNRVMDMQEAREVVEELRSAVHESQKDVKKWDGAFPFERAASSLEFWRV
ncbi:hypothetical protein BN946_scf184590.g9 [Trametes cinnabarina]|uniref:Uncharacterized protein n=1 Tax=Pycnoporus cinnabarinus TaxID=5643 RepID=A0A060SKU3_PYCCI|nr:hypothetical protein BN946_scf184590.g9 [Trametes cinnabarina]